MPTRSANSFHAVFSLHHPQTYSFSNSSPSVKLCLYLSDNFLSSVWAKLSVLLWTKRACKEDRLLLEDGKILRSIWITKAQAHSYGQKNLSSCKTSGGKTLSSPSGTKGLQQASTEGTFPFSSKGRGGVVPSRIQKSFRISKAADGYINTVIQPTGRARTAELPASAVTSLCVKAESWKQRTCRVMSIKRKRSNVCWWQECIKVDLGTAGELEGMEHQLTCSVTVTQYSPTEEFCLCWSIT